MFRRATAYLTLGMYLMVGTVAYRFYTAKTQTVAVSSNYLQIFSKTDMKSQAPEEFSVPEIKFSEIRFPAEAEKVVAEVSTHEEISINQLVEDPKSIDESLLPFYEPVVLTPVYFSFGLPQNLVSLYKEFHYEEKATPVMVAEAKKPIEDTVSTKRATLQEPADAEPEFFEYAETAAVAEKEPKKEIPKALPETTPAVAEAATRTPEAVKVEEAPVAEVASQVSVVDPDVTADVATQEEISINDLVAFDHTKANKAVAEKKMPTVSTVVANVTPGAAPVSSALKPVLGNVVQKPAPVTIQKPTPEVSEASTKMAAATVQKSLLAAVKPAQKTYPAVMNIQITATDLKRVKSETGFEVRFQDDLSEASQDYNSGQVTIKEDLANARMTRSLTILKRGYAPTNTDLILEEGETTVSLPLIEEEKFNSLLSPYETRGEIGAVLVELDDESDGADLDIPYSEVLQLDGDLKQTKSGDFRYALFLGVKAGNALLSYKTFKGQVISKVIHVHERELTFESNFYENVTDEKIRLYEEDLLSKEKTPLIISSEQVKHFATTKTSKKINDHTHMMDYSQVLKGGRRYLELGHQDEPVFVGIREATEIKVPSENFMRFILSKIEGSKLGNRCLIQVNLGKKALKVDVAAESVGSNLMTYTQILDTDGRFYDSISEKSRKVIVVGENQGALEVSQEGKVNFKITYQDGSLQYLSSYCSPNSYVVEQL